MRRYLSNLVGLLAAVGLVVGLAPAAHAASPIGNFEAIVADQYGIRVAGWALDPDTNAPIQVHVYINGSFWGLGIADQSRPDVDAVYHKGTNHGFNFHVGSPGGTVCAWAIDSNGKGPNIRLGCRSFPATAPPKGGFDASVPVDNGIRVQGWTFDPDTTAPIGVHVYVNGKIAAVGTADRPRPDVDAVFHTGANHGFDVYVPTLGGTVCVYALNFGGGTNPSIGCKSVPASAEPFGSFEALTRPSGTLLAQGWAIDPDTTGPIQVHAYFNDTFAAAATANVSRPDVGAAYGKGDNHGFKFAVPGSGPGVVCVYAINYGGGNNPLLGCKQAP